MTITRDFPDGTKWPRIYSTTLPQRLAMPQKELEALWREYREFWVDAIPDAPQSATNQVNNALQEEYQADWLEDREGTYR